jgi:adiponectin receptor
MITTFCLALFLISLPKCFSTPEKRKLRGFLFLIVGLSTAIPMIHLGLIRNTINTIQDQSFLYYILGGVFYVAGALIYIMRFPERKFPGKFCLVVRKYFILNLFNI